MDRGVLEKIKNVIYDVAGRYNIEIDRIILFGSRARGDHREDSDWDILIIVRDFYGKRVLDDFWLDVKRKLVGEGIISEILVVDREKYERYRHLTGFVYYWAEKEGILVT